MEKLTKYERKIILQSADNIARAFPWGKTKQGWDYWDKVRNELLELSKETKCPTRGKEIKE